MSRPERTPRPADYANLGETLGLLLVRNPRVLDAAAAGVYHEIALCEAAGDRNGLDAALAVRHNLALLRALTVLIDGRCGPELGP